MGAALFGLLHLATGLGTLHAQEGFPLCCSLDQCALQGLVPALEQAKHELLTAGVADPDTLIRDSIADMTQPIPPEWRTSIATAHWFPPAPVGSGGKG